MRKFIRGLKNPTVIAVLSLVIALVGGIPGFLTIKNDLFKARVDVAYDKEHTFLAMIASDQKERHGKRVIGFYGLRFFGSGETATTIKNIELYIKIGWRWVQGTRIDLHTNHFSGAERRSDVILLGNKAEVLVLTESANFRGFLGQYYIERGKTVPFNVAFMFDIHEREIEDSKRWQFVITDFADKKYTTTIDSPKVQSVIAKNLVLFDFYLANGADIEELLKDRVLDYRMIQKFLTSKDDRAPWYE